MAPTCRHCAAVATGMAVGVATVATYGYRRGRRPRWTLPGGRVVQTASLSVHILGDTGPRVLLLHGLVASGLYWGIKAVT